MNSRPKKSEALTAATDRASREVSQSINKGTIVSNSNVAVTNKAITTPDLTVIDGQVTTTSLQIAEHFGKLHKTVLRAITNLECSPEFTERNFVPSEYADATGRKLPCYRITRDGFVFLAMGFTGKEAAQWKEAYITAFNKMEAKLRSQTVFPVQPGQSLTAEQALDLRHLVGDCAKKVSADTKVQGKFIMQAWSKLKSHFKVSYRLIPQESLQEALSIVARHAAEWELVDETTQPALQAQLPRLQLRHIPPAIGTYRYNPANPYPAKGRTIEVAKSIVLDIQHWSDGLPPQARIDLYEASQTLYELLVGGWTEVDEALGQMRAATHFLNRWQGRGGRIGNMG